MLYRPREGQEECLCPPQDGQYISPSLCDQDGGNSIHQTNSSGMPDLGLVSSETNNPLSITFTGLGQSCGRSRIQAGTDLSRMEAPQGDLQGNLYSAGTVQSRPICNSTESPSRPICELETRSRSNGNQCLSPQLERPRRLCLSSLLTDRQVPSARTEHNYASGSSMVEPKLVSDAPGVDGGVSAAFAGPEGHTERSNKPTSPNGMPQQAKTSCLESLQEHSIAGVSKETSELLLVGWSNGTNMAYQSGWKCWSG